jgi:hypothetical protein
MLRRVEVDRTGFMETKPRLKVTQEAIQLPRRIIRFHEPAATNLYTFDWYDF